MDPSPVLLVYALAALALVLGLIGLSTWLARCFGLPAGLSRATGRLAITEMLQIDPKRRLLILRCDKRECLVLTGGGDVILGWLPGESPKS
jgi:flagellar protein FliO/FliZ